MGDTVEVRGVFHADCAEHGGDFDIHASSLTVLQPGREVDISPDAERYYAAALSLLFLLLTLLPLARRRTEERRSARALLVEQEEK
ncbi:MAG: hypothetical protein QME84_02860 [Actinomycetota bacterium]|nr:hypothetical protein [Actinomycetota bacterium]